METLWIGIDMAKASLEALALWQTESVRLGEFANERSGFVALAAQVQAEQARRGAVAVHWIVEPTGGYELPFTQRVPAFAHEQGWRISLPNPRQVRQWAQGTGQRAKTDRQDAYLLARYGAAQGPAPHAPLAGEVSRGPTGRDSLLQRRRDLEQMLQQEKNRIEALPGALWARPGIASPVIANLERVIQALQEALQEVENAIAAHQRQHLHLQQDAQRLLALPGVGPKVVLPLLVQLHRWQTLTAGQGTVKGLTAFVGLDPQPYESGGCPLGAVRRRSSISKMGNAELRRLLYMGALSALHGLNPLHAFYQRLVGRGKAKKLVVVAAARKLLSWAWMLFSRQTDWQPEFHAI